MNTDILDEILDYEEDDDLLPPNETLLNNKDKIYDKESQNESSQETNTYFKSFRDLMLRPELIRAINDAGFESPSAVQNECIPQATLGVDILCQAKSGMGKTCVFVLSTLQQMDTSFDKIMVLVLCHTRELAFQISKEFERFSKYMKVNVAVFFGGILQKVDEQVLQINKPQVVVATTGRLMALIRCQKIDLRHVRHFILDECDKMLGLQDLQSDINDINWSLPHQKQVMMFSATMNEQVRKTAKKLMKDPLEVIIGDDTQLTLHGLQQFYVETTEKEKLRVVYKLFTTIEFTQAIMFVSTVSRCNALADLMLKLKLSVIKIHGGMSQAERLSAYETFKLCKRKILVATKMFERGIDFERVNLVINYDMPDDSDTYLHAVGRAGRFGTKGVAVSLIANPQAEKVRQEIQMRFNITLKELPDNVVI